MKRLALGVVVAGLMSVAVAEGAEIASGPVSLSAGETIVCTIANTGAANVNNVGMHMQFSKADGSTNGTGTKACGTLSPRETCLAEFGGFPDDASGFCEVTYPSGQIRATICNVTRGLCSDAR